MNRVLLIIALLAVSFAVVALHHHHHQRHGGNNANSGSGNALFAEALVGASPSPRSVDQSYIDRVAHLCVYMELRWRWLDMMCSPNAPFALTYLYMTRGLRDNIQGLYFDDGEKMANFTLAFAQRYLDAVNSWYFGIGGAPTQPWLEQFEWGAKNMSSTMQDLVLGMNAHINYDLALTVYHLNYGVPANKNDFDRINDILTAMTQPVSEDIASRYDPSFSPTLLNTFMDPLVQQGLFSWRENAWQMGVALMNADTETDKNRLMSTILTEAVLIAKTQQTPTLIPSHEDKLAYCQANHHL